MMPAGLGTRLARMRCMTMSTILRLASVAALCGVSAASAEEVNFFAGKTIQLVIGFDVGGGYDLYAAPWRGTGRSTFSAIRCSCRRTCRAPAPARPQNWLYNVGPKDGTAVGTVVQSTPCGPGAR